jgi:hypothetical protein
MNRTFKPSGKARIRALWIGLAALCVLPVVAAGVFKIYFPFSGSLFTIAATLIIAYQNRPTIWRDGDTIVFRHPARKTTKTKPIDAELAKVVEWSGYEGTLYDIIWKDGETWTIPAGYWASLERITRALKECGITHVPIEKDLMVFRPSPVKANSPA